MQSHLIPKYMLCTCPSIFTYSLNNIFWDLSQNLLVRILYIWFVLYIIRFGVVAIIEEEKTERASNKFTSYQVFFSFFGIYDDHRTGFGYWPLNVYFLVASQICAIDFNHCWYLFVMTIFFFGSDAFAE